MGFELVQVRFMKGARSTTLQVMAEPRDRQRIMTVDDCAELSHAISAVLDVADPVAGTYRLEVSSPGIDRPLVKAADYDRFAGEPARIELDEPIEGRRKFTGRLGGLDDGDVLLNVEGVEHRLPLRRIGKAKLMAAEELLGTANRTGRRGGRAQRTG
jgi:ribosome maturation factor RimP